MIDGFDSPGAERPTTFLRLVLPRHEGLRYCLAVKSSQGVRHYWSPAVEALPRGALVATRQHDCWLACAGYGAKNKRTGENAICAGAFWLDVDWGEDKPYADEPAARAALQEFLYKTNLPDPVVVASGGGMHLWWPLREPLAKTAWRDAALSLKLLCERHGFHPDSARTADIASLMRMPGTLNHKYNPSRLVVWDEREDDFDTDEFLELLKATLARAQPKARGKAKAHDPLTAVAGAIYPHVPTSAAQIAEHCAQLALMRDSKGNVDEPLWYANFCVLACCDDGETLAHAWSSGYPNYTFAETAAKFEHAKADSPGPTTCARFHSLKPELCEACTLWEEITSPIEKGRAHAPDVTESTAPDAEDAAPDAEDAEAEAEDAAAPDGPNPDLLRLQQFAAPPFPKDVIPTSWWPWVAEAAEGAGAPLDYVALALFAAVAGLIGNARRVSPWPQWEEAMALDVALVGDPSSNKSPAADPVRNLLVKLEQEQNQDWAARQRQYKRDLAVAKAKQSVWEKKLKAALKAGESPPDSPEGSEAPELPEPIHKRRLFSISPTQEQAAHLSEQNPRGMTLFRDELAGWIGEADRYASGASPGSDRVFWTEAYGGRYWGADRVDQARDVAVPHLLWTIIGGIQPDRLRNLFGDNNDGMAARFIYTWPTASDPSIPTRAADMTWAQNRLHWLIKLPWETAPEPKLILLTKAAAEAVHSWQNEVRVLSKAATGLFQGWLGKLPGLCLRLATVLTYLEWCGGPAAGAEPQQIEALAIAQARYFLTDYAIPMAQRTFGESALPEEERDARTIVRWLLAQDPVPEVINETDMVRKPSGPGIKKRQRLVAALELLAEEGWVRPPIRKSGGKGGRPRKDWGVHPAVATMVRD
jgi:hypothetical protein